MKTKKFLMTSLLVMGMIIARAANGYPPELVLVSQPVLTYNSNSVTIYYDVQNIGDYTYRGYLYIYLDPDNGYCFANEYMRVCPGCIRRISVTIPAYRPNPSWLYTVMPYYELNGELYSFTTFEYFEPVRFCWYGPHNEPWVVIRIGPRPRYYHRPGEYRYYYDGYRPMLPPPPPGGHHDPHYMPPMDPHHHTYGYHHSNGGYPANFTPEHETPGYNKPADASVVRPSGSDGPSSMSTHSSVTPSPNNNGNNNGPAVAPSSSSSSSSTTTGRPSSASSTSSSSNSSRSGNSSSSSVRPSSSDSGSSSVRPSSSSSSSSSTRPSSASSTSSRSSSSGSSSVSRPSSSSSSSSNRSGSSSSSSSRSSSSSSSSSRGSSSSSGRR